VTSETGKAPIKLLVINQYYEPDIAATGVLLTQLCEDLAAQGLDVRVITAQPSYTESSQRAPEHEVRNGVEVHRISLGDARGRASMRTRLRGYFRFLYGAKRLGSRLASDRRPDIIITASNPPLLERVGSGLAKKFHSRFVHIVHDIHPDVLIASGQIKLPPLSARVWKTLSVRALRKADRVIVLSNNMKRNLVEVKGLDARKVEVINLWAVPDVWEVPRPGGGDRRGRVVAGLPGQVPVSRRRGDEGFAGGSGERPPAHECALPAVPIPG
jgi:glycosyltransferase involved in cell wall biosynthesis